MTQWLRPPGQQGPGLGQQLAEKAATKIATDQVAKLGLQAAGTAAGGPLGGAIAGAAGDLAAPLLGQAVGALFNKGGPVYMQGGDLVGPSRTDLLAALSGLGLGGQAANDFIKQSGITEFGSPTGGGQAPSGNPIPTPTPKTPAPTQPAPKRTPTPVEAEIEASAPRSKASGQWDVPLGKLFGADWSTQGAYSDSDMGKDPWSAALKGSWKFNKGGAVKPAYMNIGGLTKGPLGMSDMSVLGKPKDVSKVKIKKNDGVNTEEVELSYHAPLAPKSAQGE